MAEERIQKIMAEQGLCSRRAAEQIIAEGRVKVNGHPVKVGDKMDPNRDVLHVDDERIYIQKNQQLYYLALYKPRGYVTTASDELGRKTGYANNAQRPKFAFMNPELTFTLPPFQTAAGLTDMFCHLLERFFDDLGAVPVTDNLNLSLMNTIRAEAPRVLADPDNYDARANIMWAGMLCHQGLAGVGRHEDWATHGLEHELSALNPAITHGAGLAVMFPAWMEYVHTENPARFAFYGQAVFGLTPTGDVEADALSAIDETRSFFASLGMPTTLAELDVEETDIPKMLPTLAQNKGIPFGTFKKLTLEDAEAIYKLAL
mgnify:CR=1 FL=1